MPISLNEYKSLSSRLYADAAFRQAFLKDPFTASANILGITLPKADVEQIKKDIWKIFVSGVRGDEGFRSCLTLILAGAGCGADEMNDRRWTPRWGGSMSDINKLEECIDGIVAEEIFSTNEIAGASVSAVRYSGGQWKVLTKGYGCADAGAKSKATENTVFRVGSVSKLVTATAVMQLTEQLGADQKPLLELDRNVNDYLPEHCKIDESKNWPPITLRHLLTHTAGFEENQVGLAKRSADELVSLEDAIAKPKHRPARVRPPATFVSTAGTSSEGTCASYSSWGIALAGYLVALRSGMSFDAYVKKNIFDCLGTQRSSFLEPLPANMQNDAAKGHVCKGRYTDWTPDADGIACPPCEGVKFEPQDFEYLSSLGPACSLSTSAADMAQFMMAHLDRGACRNGRLFKPETAELMHRCHLNPDQSVNGSGLGFYEWKLNGQRLLCHQGVTVYFNSMLVLYPSDKPDERFGLFIAVNTGGMSVNSRIHWFVRDFMQAYYEPTAIPDKPIQGTASDCAGSYIANTHSYTRTEKAVLLHPAYEVKVVPARDDTAEPGASTHNRRLKIHNLGWLSWKEFEPGKFKQEGGGVGLDRIAFQNDRAHIVGPMPFDAHSRARWHESPSFHRWLLLIAAICFSAALGANGGHVSGLLGVPALPGRFPLAGLASWLVIAVSVLNLAAMSVGYRTLYPKDPAQLQQLAFGFPPLFKAGLYAVMLSLTLTLLLGVLIVAGWVLGGWRGSECIFYALFMVPALAFMWSMHVWNLIGRKFAW